MLVPPPIPGFVFFQGPSVKIGQFHLSKCVVSNWQCGPKKIRVSGIGTVHELAAQRTNNWVVVWNMCYFPALNMGR